ncbi:1,3-beta-glucanosyltransferase gel2 [Aspergillus novofumigatus IBT 16806]|uniref:1,3-beta-glucanosyltransferase n=1 Tax=Aspergillus novofumigatus (strain IBT 16806) TaxID=1392255 RepID=A0A2I1CC54_ASPN1|nr:1,3-beta-glucanosyltransferase Gel2 [Aspergillus novofumigatus IBT 16806]PKX95207.1 1,3-beta-glucanosyltransferase Gel2 [Aspergillus novofumigatus IBT 16806]
MLPTYVRLFTAVCALATTASAVVPIEVKGKDFVNSETGARFQILGVDYQPGGSSGFTKDKDPLSDPDACLRDAALMQRLGVNTIRIYNLSPSLNHDECASIFNAAGIYMILDVNSPLYGGYLDRTDPESTYNDVYFQQVFGVVEAFKNFPNTLAFFAGNEVINEQSVKHVPTYVRAIQRDMKDYIAKNLNRSIPVGYSAADIRPILMDTLNYFMCADDANSQSDFFGLNSYSWCGNSSYTKSGYDVLTEDFADASIPVFFSEYGCNEVQPRYFTEVEALYGQQMTQSFSGGLVYEYTQEENDYGLVQINDNSTVTLLVDYDNLMAHLQHNPDLCQAPKCDSSLITNSTFTDSFDLPKRPSKVQNMIDNGLSDANTGKLVEVKSTDIKQKIYNANGQEITGIKLNILASGESNTPGAHSSGSTSGSSGSGSSGSSSSSGSDKKEGAAGTISVPFVGLLSAASFMAFFML